MWNFLLFTKELRGQNPGETYFSTAPYQLSKEQFNL